LSLRSSSIAATELRLRFPRLHLVRWVQRFTEAIRAEAETAFCRTLADVTQRFVSMESV
jgi:TorA maturation chaperone TorD